MTLSEFFTRVDDYVAETRVGKYFKIKERGSTFSKEVIGGFAVYLVISYISPVASAIIAETGGTCDLSAPADEFAICRTEIRRELITSVAITSMFSCLLMGLWANLPFVLAPGIGGLAYFTYSVVGVHGSGSVKYETAKVAVFLEGIAFLLLAVSGLRSWAVKAMPESIKLGMAGGIGMFLAFIGMQSSEGIGLIAGSADTLVHLGGCPEQFRKYMGPDGTGNYECAGGMMQSATTWIGLIALLVMTALLQRGVRSSVGCAVLIVSVMSWFRGTPFTFFPDNEVGDEKYAFFTKVVQIKGLNNVVGAFSMSQFLDGRVWIALLTFLYTDVLETTGALYSMARQGGLVKEDGSFEGERAAFCVDALGACVAGFFGLSPVIVFIESAVAIEIGARTGIAAIIASFGFLISIFFNPILSSVPPWATGPALILVGSIMIENLAHIDWKDRRTSLPAFMTAILMPLTYSIAYGVIGGLFTLAAMHILHGSMDKFDQWRDPEAFAAAKQQQEASKKANAIETDPEACFEEGLLRVDSSSSSLPTGKPVVEGAESIKKEGEEESKSKELQ